MTKEAIEAMAQAIGRCFNSEGSLYDMAIAALAAAEPFIQARMEAATAELRRTGCYPNPPIGSGSTSIPVSALSRGDHRASDGGEA